MKGEEKNEGEEEEREVVVAKSPMGGMCGILNRPSTQQCHRTPSPLLAAS